MLKSIKYILPCFCFIFFTGCNNSIGNQVSDLNNQTNFNVLASSSHKSEQLNNILNEFVESYGTDYYFSAISASVKCGNNQASGFAGVIESATNTPIDEKSLFEIGSTSKSFTSVVILQLADDPKYNFSLNDTIGKWFKNSDGSLTYPMWESVTITQLMNMSSGIPDYFNDYPDILITSLLNPNKYFSPTELISSIKSKPIIFSPGNGYHYSNTDYILLGMLIQKLTGNSPITEIQNRIFKPLNLIHTYFPDHLPANVVPINDMINGYGFINFFPEKLSQLNDLYNFTWSSLSIYYTAGGIISTPEDLLIYAKALYTPGKLLTENQLTKFKTYMVSQNPTDGYPNGGQQISNVDESTPVGYGLGVFNIYSSESLGSYYMYNGATLGYGSYYAHYPKNDMYIVLMINNGINMGLSDTKYQDLINQIVQYTLTTQCTKS